MTNNCLKSEKGVTLLTLTIYIIVLTAIVGIMAGVSSLFYNNIGMMKDAAENAGDFDTLNRLILVLSLIFDVGSFTWRDFPVSKDALVRSICTLLM